MSTLAEIESAAERLPVEEKQELLLYLAARIRAEGGKLPEPRKFSREQINQWIEQDERWPLLRAGLSARVAIAHGAGDAAWAEQAAREMAQVEQRYNQRQ